MECGSNLTPHSEFEAEKKIETINDKCNMCFSLCLCVCAYKRISNAFCKRICRWAAYGRPTTQIPRQVGGWSMQGNEIESFFFFFYNKTEADEINESVKKKTSELEIMLGEFTVFN